MSLQKANAIALARISKLQSQSQPHSNNANDAEDEVDSSAEAWPSAWHLLENILVHPDCDDILAEAPSLRNRIRISQRIERLIPELWAFEKVQNALEAQQSRWARLSYTLNPPDSETCTDIFIRNSATDMCVRIESPTFPDSNQLAGIRFWYESTPDGSLPATSRTLGTWLDQQDHPKVEMKGRHITGVVLSLNKREFDQGVDRTRQGIHGLKVSDIDGYINRDNANC